MAGVDGLEAAARRLGDGPALMLIGAVYEAVAAAAESAARLAATQPLPV